MRKKHKERDKRQILLISICLCLILGIILGAVAANSLDEMQFNELGGYLAGFIDTIKNEGISSEGALSQVIIKYSKYILLIWLAGFMSPGAIVVLLVIIFRGISYGFTTAVLAKQYGGVGITFAMLAYLPQNIILIPVYIAQAYLSMEFILRKFKVLPPKAKLKREQQKNVLEYIIILFVGILLVVIASLVEVYVVPILLSL